MAMARKMLASFFMVMLFTVCTGTTVFASQTAERQSGASDSEDVVTRDVAARDKITGDVITEDIAVGDLVTEDVVAEEITEYNMDLLLQEGYYLDEQGQLCYDEPVPKSADSEPEEADFPIIQDNTVTYSEEDLRLLSCLVYSEAGNQSDQGMLAVANVVLNRVKSKIYSHVDTIKEVIYDKKWTVQFAVTIKNKKTGLSMLDNALKLYDTRKFTGSNPDAQKKALDKARKAAKAALGGNNNIGNYLCFQNKRSAGRIKKRYSDTRVIGDHIFFRTE